ncbi:MAG TPA: type II toxin-antitoxin system VapC family toxin [Streptosporangiaceae bacterium]|nr:type II toxin-antitoxin system VapC family toxin [Streptosporangiaceae bacterium]
MIVLDASAALSGLLNAGPARMTMSEQQVHVPHLIDSEVASGLSRRVAAQQISGGDGWAALDVWRRLAVTRYAVTPVLDRIWELRDNVSAHDAGYIALAERLGCAVVTADARLSRAPGIRCPVMVVPR